MGLPVNDLNYGGHYLLCEEGAECKGSEELAYTCLDLVFRDTRSFAQREREDRHLIHFNSEPHEVKVRVRHRAQDRRRRRSRRHR